MTIPHHICKICATWWLLATLSRRQTSHFPLGSLLLWTKTSKDDELSPLMCKISARASLWCSPQFLGVSNPKSPTVTNIGGRRSAFPDSSRILLYSTSTSNSWSINLKSAFLRPILTNRALSQPPDVRPASAWPGWSLVRGEPPSFLFSSVFIWLKDSLKSLTLMSSGESDGWGVGIETDNLFPMQSIWLSLKGAEPDKGSLFTYPHIVQWIWWESRCHRWTIKVVFSPAFCLFDTKRQNLISLCALIRFSQLPFPLKLRCLWICMKGKGDTCYKLRWGRGRSLEPRVLIGVLEAYLPVFGPRCEVPLGRSPSRILSTPPLLPPIFSLEAMNCFWRICPNWCVHCSYEIVTCTLQGREDQRWQRQTFSKAADSQELEEGGEGEEAEPRSLERNSQREDELHHSIQRPQSPS